MNLSFFIIDIFFLFIVVFAIVFVCLTCEIKISNCPGDFINKKMRGVIEVKTSTLHMIDNFK